MKKLNTRFLVIVATHGDEAFSLPMIKKIKSRYPNDFDFIVGNPRALAKNKRFIDVDLNRVAPGRKNSNRYEEKRAKEIIEISNAYSFVLDMHGTVSSSGIFTIVTNPTPQNMYLAYSLPIKRIVIWGSKNNAKKRGPLSRFVDCGVGIECGPKNSKDIKRKLREMLKNFLSRCNQLPDDTKELYQIFGSVRKDELKESAIKLKDFKEIALNGQSFFPLLVNQYSDQGIVCYKLRKLDFYKQFSFPY